MHQFGNYPQVEASEILSGWMGLYGYPVSQCGCRTEHLNGVSTNDIISFVKEYRSNLFAKTLAQEL
jgi:hypothetical protein